MSHRRLLIKAATDAIKLLGNANARISHLLHTKMITKVNKNLLLLVEEDSGKFPPPYLGWSLPKSQRNWWTR